MSEKDIADSILCSGKTLKKILAALTVPTTVVPIISKDVEFVANNDTGFYDKVTYTYVNGILQSEVTTPTIYPTTGLPPAQVDYEWVCDTATGFQIEIEIVTDALGVSTKTYTPTTISCVEKKTNYDNIKQYEVVYPNNLIISADTAHSISYKILEGSVDISIGGDSFIYITGECDMEEADAYIKQEYIFTPQQNSKIKIKKIY